MIEAKERDSETITFSIYGKIFLKVCKAMNDDTVAVVGWKHVNKQINVPEKKQKDYLKLLEGCYYEAD